MNKIHLYTKILLLSIVFPIHLMAQEDNTKKLGQVLWDFQKKVKKVELENGLRLIMLKRSYAPTVACYIKFKSGSSDETNESSGIAHMLEHMLFKGTRKLGVRDYEKEEKYLRVVNRWAARLDNFRRQAEEAEARGDEEAEEEALEGVRKWKRRLKAVTDKAREFMVSDEDNYLYSLNGQRGYNAYTSRDFTNYQVQLPANRLEVWARIESDRVQNSVLRDFYTERDVVTEERRWRVDNVARSLLFEKFLSEVYGDHPYGRSLIGPMKSIQYLNYEQAFDFYKTYYAPNNTVISLVGDVDFDEAEALVRKYFGNMERRKIPPVKAAPPPERSEPLLVELEKEASPVQLMAWFKPSMPDPADLRLEILSRILAGGDDSRLFRRLVVRDKIASQIAAYSAYPGERFTNLFLIYAVPAPNGSYEAVEEGVLDELRKIKEEGVTGDEMQRVVRDIQAEILYSLRSNSFLADNFSKYELITGDFSDVFRSYSRLDEITAADIQKAAQKYLNDEKVMKARLQTPAPADDPEDDGISEEYAEDGFEEDSSEEDSQDDSDEDDSQDDSGEDDSQDDDTEEDNQDDSGEEQ